MKVPANLFNSKDLEFVFPRGATVDDLLDAVEDRFADFADAIGLDIQLAANVAWNTKQPKKALDTKDPLHLHFACGDTCGIHGDIEKAGAPAKLPEEEKIPILILTGFLGAGKTTLLNYILEQQTEKKIAVIENEFGEVAIDDALLAQGKIATTEKVTTLNNGCMCCTVREDLEGALRNILAAATDRDKIDMVIIETTGLADPVPIVRTIKQNPHAMACFRLDGIVTVADAKHLPGLLAEKAEQGTVNEAYQQIAFADRVLLSKMDLVSVDEVISVKASIRSINRFAKMVGSFNGRINLDELMNLHAYSLQKITADDFEIQDDMSLPPVVSARPRKGSMNLMTSAFGGFSSKSRHSTRLGSFSIVQEGEISAKILQSFLGCLQQPDPGKGKLYRFKAILAVKGSSRKLVVHAVQDVVDTAVAAEWQDGEPRVCKLVFIGKDLEREYFQQLLSQATAFKPPNKHETSRSVSGNGKSATTLSL